ncbi:MAG: glycosyltransferase family 39 protein [bacterium]
MFNGKADRWDFLISFSIGVFIFISILWTSDITGLVRDEGFYMKAADIMADWYESMEKSFSEGKFTEPFASRTIKRYFTYNNEHPAFMKMLYGSFLYIFHRKTELLSFVKSMRAVAALLAALTAVMIYLFSIYTFSCRKTAVVSSMLFISMPHMFFHSHLVCFDVPVLFFWTLLFFLYARYIVKPSTWTAFITAVVFGISMAVKHNVFFFPFLIFPIWVLFHFSNYSSLETKKRGISGFFRSVPLLFYLFPLVSLPVYLFHWPWLWYNTFHRFKAYIDFHVYHVNYTNYYFGQELARAPFPFSFPWVMTSFTTPLPQLVVFIAAVFLFAAVIFNRKTKSSHRHAIFALATGAFFPITLIALPSVPIFGGIKHWFTAYPILIVMGTFPVVQGTNSLFEKKLKLKQKWAGFASAIIFAVVLTSVSIPCIKFIKRGPAFFNTLAGGVQGAAEKQMQRNFWGYDIMDLIDVLNEEAPRNARVFIMSYAEGLNRNSFRFMKKEGMLRNDLRAVNNLKKADMAFFFFEKQNEYVIYDIYEEFGTAVPLALSEVDSVLYSALFRREK